MKRLALLALVFVGGCRGTTPQLFGPPEQGISSILIGCRMKLPTGETSNGKSYLNFESEEGGETYRLRVEPQRALLYQVEPGLYRLTPARSLFGFHQQTLKLVMDGRTYKVPFPRDILRKPTIDVKPTKIVAIGVLDVELVTRPLGKKREPVLKVRLDDSVEARRELVTKQIRLMMDPNAPYDEREAALAWTRALDETLSDIITESQRGPSFRAAP